MRLMDQLLKKAMHWLLPLFHLILRLLGQLFKQKILIQPVGNLLWSALLALISLQFKTRNWLVDWTRLHLIAYMRKEHIELPSSLSATSAASASRKDEQMAKTDMAVASAATLVAAQCVEAAEAMRAEREHLIVAVNYVVNVKSHGDILTLTAAAATGTCCVYIQKKKMNDVPELAEMKRRANTRSLKEMALLLRRRPKVLAWFHEGWVVSKVGLTVFDANSD